MHHAFEAAFLTVLVIPLLIGIARRLGLVDRPGGRKHHAGEVPLVGGLAIFLSLATVLVFQSGLLLSWGLLLQAGSGGSGVLIFGLLAAAAVIAGLVDDLSDLPPVGKLAIQFAIALLAVFWGGHALGDLGNIVGSGALVPGVAGPVLSVIGYVAMMNAVNLIDGADGVAGGVSCVILAGLIALAGAAGVAPPALAGIALGAILGFLAYNMPLPWRRRPMVFLGDAGSMLIGFALTWASLDLHQAAPALPPIMLAWVLAMPIVDMAAVAFSRLLRRKSPFTPGRDHLHHLMLDRGMPAFATALTVSGIALLFAGVGVAGAVFGLSEKLLFGLLLAVTVAYVLATHRLRLVQPRAGRTGKPPASWVSGHPADKEQAASRPARAA